jgi:predicted ABC-type ATPase
MKDAARELLRVAQDVLPAARAIITFPREEGVPGYAYNDVHFEVQKLLDRVRKNEAMESFILRKDNNEAMVLEIGFSEHEAVGPIIREVVSKAKRVADKVGIPRMEIGVADGFKPMIDEALGLVKAAEDLTGDPELIMASDPLCARIWDAFIEMGVVPAGPIAGKIRWQAVFFIGPAGSGKSFIRNAKYVKHLDFKVVDPDEIKKLHPDYDPDAPFKVHQWSKAKSQAEFRKTVESGTGQPIIVDGTGRNISGILGNMKEADDNGYRTYIVYVYVPFEISIFRNRNRQRFVPEDVIIEQSEKIGKNYAVLKRKADKAKVIPNYSRGELAEAKQDIKLYPVPQKERPPRPGDPMYGVDARAASEG